MQIGTRFSQFTSFRSRQRISSAGFGSGKSAMSHGRFPMWNCARYWLF
jgi:hypothetical protein